MADRVESGAPAKRLHQADVTVSTRIRHAHESGV
jgi:hypothetical protein